MSMQDASNLLSIMGCLTVEQKPDDRLEEKNASCRKTISSLYQELRRAMREQVPMSGAYHTVALKRNR